MQALDANLVLELALDCATVEDKQKYLDASAAFVDLSISQCPTLQLNDTLSDNISGNPPRSSSDVIENLKIPFLQKWTMDESKIPKYPLFKKTFTEIVDKKLCELILECEDPRISMKSKSLFRNTVYKNISLNQLKVRYSNRKGLGRVYPDRDVGLTPQCKCIKNIGSFGPFSGPFLKKIKRTRFFYIKITAL